MLPGEKALPSPIYKFKPYFTTTVPVIFGWTEQ